MTPWRIANTVMLALFAFGAVVQVNDPDPVRWVAIYAIAALGCAMELLRRTVWWHAALVGAIALAWGATLVAGVVGNVPFADMFSAWEMKNEGIEASREMYGLAIIGAWMIVLAVVAYRRRVPSARHPGDAHRVS